MGRCGHEDRGDGVLILVPAELPKGLLVESLPSALVTALHAHNGTHPGPERIRLRMALHAGEVNYDEHGVTAASINLAFRLLERARSRRRWPALRGAGGHRLVVVLRGGRAAQPAAAAAYCPVRVAVKETTTIGWICLPDQLDPSGQAMPEHLPAVTETPGGPPAVALRSLPRDTAAFTGRTRELDRLVAAASETVAIRG